MATQFTPTDHHTWKLLCQRQLPLVDRFACSLFKSGLDKLNMNLKTIPTLSQLNSQITPSTGWTITQTNTRYLNHIEWFTSLANRIFPITNYIRGPHELDFTPEPDVFHDIFGHQPYMVLPEFTEVFDLFATAYQKATTPDHKRLVGRLAWFGYEFGLIVEAGQPKAFGAGLMSSFSEIQNLSDPQIPKRPFTIENVALGAKPQGHRVGDRVYGVTENTELFVIQSLNHLKSELNRFIASL